MSAFAYRVGVPEEDAFFLLSGFSDPHHEAGGSWRNCSKVFRLRVPSAGGGQTRIALRMRFVDPSLRLHLRAGDAALGTIAPTDAEWKEYAFALPPGATAGAGGLVTLTGELDREPYDPPAPKVDPNRSFVDLAQVSAEAADGSDLAVPEDCTREMISRAPIRLVNFRRSANKVRKPPPAGVEKKIFFGDIHVHTNYSVCGRPNNGTVEENVAAARERGFDFLAITDHCEHMDLDTWKRYFEEIDACSRKYDIPIIPGTEWTSRDHGHRNLYFLRPGGGTPPYVDYFMHETNHPDKLAAFFRRHGLDGIAVPHHFPYVEQPGDIGSIAPEVEPLIEIYSHWGSSEHYGARLQDTRRVMPGATVKDALAKGLKLGFVGGGDVHNDLPGDGGITALLADDLTVEALFAAMKSRLCYATSGERVLLDFSINGYPTGSVLSVNQYSIDKLYPLAISVSAVCPAPAERMELIGNGEVIHTTGKASAGRREIGLNLSVEKQSTPGGLVNALNQQLVNHSRYYYVRVVQHDGGTAWSSPIWIDFEHQAD